jgi:glycosyltransferase involved in cell wall biosynthesis
MRNEIQVNEYSIDNTEAALTSSMNTTPNLTINLFKQDVNQRKGAVIQTGIAQATGDYLLVQDADLDMIPANDTLLKPIEPGSADVVYGSRFMGGHPHRILFFWHHIAIVFFASLSNCMITLCSSQNMQNLYNRLSFMSATITVIHLFVLRY